jgi:hypothetical protein
VACGEQPVRKATGGTCSYWLRAIDHLVHVRRNVQRLPEIGLSYGSPKPGRSRRTVPLPTRSVKVLRTDRVRQAAEALALERRWAETGLVFTSAAGWRPRHRAEFF